MTQNNWILLGSLAAAAALGGLWLYRKRRRTEGSEEADLYAGLVRHAERFDGLYEALYQSVEAEPFCADAYIEWQERVRNLSGDDPYIALFTKAFPFHSGASAPEQQAAEKLLQCLGQAGFVRIEEARHTVQDGTWKQYRYLGQPQPSVGTVCRVLKPCWMVQQRVAEQGLLVQEGESHGT